MKKIYPNLNSLRFIAALLVIVFHIELHKYLFKLPNLYSYGFFQIIGKLGVVLFFVLSGFLITSLLLNEKVSTKNIHIKNFYIRRILRIWPLYYLIIIISFYLIPYIPILTHPDKTLFPDTLTNTYPTIFYYLTIFANLAVPMFNHVAYASQTWSIATEEQFYLIWPLIFAYIKKINNILLTIFLILFLYWGAIYLTDHTNIVLNILGDRYKFILSGYLFYFNINCMAIGGIFAVLVHKKSILIKFLFNKYIFFSSLLLTLFFLIKGIHFGFFHYDIYSVLFAILITNLACNEKYSKALENKQINYLGSISYGIYMWHAIPLIISIKLAILWDATWIIYPFTIVVTYVMSYFSYKYFEEYFLKLKSKFL